MNVEGLRHVEGSLETLGIGRTKRPLTLAVLARRAALRSLRIEGQHRDPEWTERMRSAE